MNSEELEISLRTEFENYLKNVFADMRQEISQLQSKIEVELENHKSQLDTAFKEVLNRADSEANFDAGFKDSVLEHLRLARDEGARITATAIAEAEDMQKQQSAAVPGIKELNAAINDISSKDSQGEILKTLVHHASQFAARGAFFVVKKDHFVAWRTFDAKNGDSEEAVREVYLPNSADSILSESVRSLATVESNSETYRDDAAILDKLGFGSPDKMYAIPLIARGRGVAVLYADYGTEGGDINVEALETMVHVAGLTVEILASANAPKRKAAAEQAAEQSAPQVGTENAAPAATEAIPSYAAPATQPAEADDDAPVAEPEETPASEYSQPVENENQGFSYSQDNSSAWNSNRDYSTKDYSAQDYATEPAAEAEPEEVKEDSSSDRYSISYPDDNSYSEQHKTEELPAYGEVDHAAQAKETYPTYDDSAWSQPAESTAATSSSEDHTVSESSVEDAPAANSWNEPVETPMISAQEYAQNFVKEADSPTNEFSFTPTIEPEPQPYQDFSANTTSEYQFEQPKAAEFETFAPTETYAPAAPESYTPPVNSYQSESVKPAESFAEPAAPPVTSAGSSSTAATPVKSRLSERNVDLPIEVSEDERRLHNDARRFARLLVSEIKLYNEQKVKEGRDSNDLYERLREAIDRSREMYDKRVQTPVAAKFDYFHYELVNTLAEGNSDKLGESYPGPAV